MKNEKRTQKEIIDSRLKQAGWNVSDRTQVIEEFNIIVDNLVQEAAKLYARRQFIDYVLLGKDQKGHNGELPFCFHTNGHDIFFWDVDNSNPLLQKIKLDKKLSKLEAKQLAESLQNKHSHTTVDLLRKVYNHRQAEFLQFIKYILRKKILESFAESVSKSFKKFVSGHTCLDSRQLEFLTLLQSFLFGKGSIEKSDLVYAPLTQIHPDEIIGVYSQKEIDEIISFIHKIAA